jgi:hypothetical protein
MRLHGTALLIASLLLPSAVGAVEVVLGVEGSTGYNSNVFFQSEDESGDGSGRLGPLIMVRDRTGGLTYIFNYRPSYELYYTLNGINSVYQNLDARVSWQPSIATEFYATNYFSDTPVRFSTFETGPGSQLATPRPVFDNSLVLQNYGNVGVRHSFSPRWLGEISANSALADYEKDTFTNSMSNGLQGSMTYFLNPRNRVGGGVGFTRQTFEQSGSTSGGTNYYQVFGLWNHDFSPTWTLSMQAGPTLVQPDSTDFPTTRTNAFLFSRLVQSQSGQVLLPLDGTRCQPFEGVFVAETCPPLQAIRNGQLQQSSDYFVFDENGQQVDLAQTGTLNLQGPIPDSGGTSITYFANVSLKKRWRWFEVTGSYVRNASTTSGLGQSILTDTLTLTGVWNPSALWRLTLLGVYTQRESSAESAFTLTPVQGQVLFNVFGQAALIGVRSVSLRAFSSSSSIDITNYGITAQLNRYLGRSTYVFGRATYDRQQSNQQEFDSVTTDRYVVTIGFHYVFDALHF